MEKVIIAAKSDNQVIGLKNRLPWYIPEDLNRFMEITKGNSCIMGRNTYLSILERLSGKGKLPETGSPLVGRKIIVLSRDKRYEVDSDYASIARSFDEAFSIASSNSEIAFVCGGQEIYGNSINQVDRLEITEVHTEIVGGDTFFPKIDRTMWKESNRERNTSKKGLEYSFVTYLRV